MNSAPFFTSVAKKLIAENGQAPSGNAANGNVDNNPLKINQL